VVRRWAVAVAAAGLVVAGTAGPATAHPVSDCPAALVEPRPEIDVEVLGPPDLAATVPLTVTLTLRIDTVRIAGQRGRIVDVRTAGCRLTADLDIGGITSTRSRDLALARLINLDPGAPLLPRAAYEAGPARSEVGTGDAGDLEDDVRAVGGGGGLEAGGVVAGQGALEQDDRGHDLPRHAAPRNCRRRYMSQARAPSSRRVCTSAFAAGVTT
jgi:hypothetical protein